MVHLKKRAISRLLIGLAFPVVTLSLQSIFWPVMNPYVWLMFFGGVAGAAWLGGRISGAISSMVSLVMAWYFFVPPEMEIFKSNSIKLIPAAVYLVLALTMTELFELSRKKTRILQDYFDQASDGIFVADLSGRYTYVNSAGCRMLGYSLEELMGKTILDIIPPEEAGRLEVEKAKMLTPGEVQVSEWSLRKKSGDFIPVEVSAKIISGGHWQAIVRDISERKKSDQILRDAIANAEAANRSKSDFLAAISHEIRTPMSIVLGYAELLLNQAGSESDRREFIESIVRNGRHLLDLVNDLLDLAKIESGTLTLNLEQVDLAAFIADLNSQFRIKAEEKGLKLEFRAAGAIPVEFQSDDLRLRQILINLISNAIKFTDRGSVVVEISYVGDSTGRKGSLHFTVKDTGSGIRPENREKIFEKFSQGDIQTSRVAGGTGLGLALARSCARMLGGDVRLLASKVGEGSTFVSTVTVDASTVTGWMDDSDFQEVIRQKKRNGGKILAPSSPIQTLRGVRVLVADDQRDNRELMRAILELYGARVTLVENGIVAIDAALAGDFDFVIMDVQMPGLSGHEAVRILRDKNYRKPVFALTANAMKGEKEKCLQSGYDEYFSKPINIQRLIAAVNQWVGERVS